MQAVNVSFLQELLNTIAEQGRQLLPWGLGGQEDIVTLSRALVSGRGEASGVAIARQILELYRRQKPAERRQFYPFPRRWSRARAQGRRGDGARPISPRRRPTRLLALQRAVESPRQEFFRRLNLAPGATAISSGCAGTSCALLASSRH